MLRETTKSLQWFFGIVAILNFFIAAGAIASVILARRAHQEVQLTPYFICHASSNDRRKS